jgi:septal ring factor EnvC (AmiA/AmiB activator)
MSDSKDKRIAELETALKASLAESERRYQALLIKFDAMFRVHHKLGDPLILENTTAEKLYECYEKALSKGIEESMKYVAARCADIALEKRKT